MNVEAALKEAMAIDGALVLQQRPEMLSGVAA